MSSTSNTSESFQVGQKAQLISDNTIGIVRYIGQIHVSAGEFIGLELPTPNGKNDGSVQGKRYFQCSPKHGIFVKPSAAKPVATASSVSSSVSATASTSVSASGPKKLSRPSMLPPSTTTAKKPPTSRLSMAPPTNRRQSTAPAPSRLSSTSRSSVREPSGKVTPPTESRQQPPATPPTTFDVENQELKAKLSVLESRRDERESLLSAALAEKDKYAGLVQKLEAKLRPLTEELQDLRAQAQEFKNSQRENEIAQEEHDLMMESLALDRELAFEANDKLKMEVAELKFKVDELELQNEIYREEKAIEDDSEAEYNPHDLVHLQVENKRMREALLKLRDLTSTEKADLELQVMQLQEEINDLPEVKVKVAELQQQLSKAQEVVDHQKSQLESSEDNETLIMEMQGQLEASTSKIGELEALIEAGNESEEINDKIIASLEEAQKGAQVELDHQRALFQAATERIVRYERTITDQDETVEKFRKLTSTLQSSLREVEGSHEASQQEKALAEKRAQHLQDLAKETQKSTERTQLREFEHQMTVLRRDLAQKELSIIRTYVPENYKTIESSVQSLLIMKNINGKIQAFMEVLRNKTHEPFTTDYDVNKIVRPRLITKLGYLDLLTDQFEEHFNTAPLPAFIKLGELNNELHSMDKAVDIWTSSLTKDSPVETTILEQAGMYTKFLDNVAEVHLPQRPRNNLDSPECVLEYERQLHHIEHDLASLQVFLYYLKEMFIKHFNADGKVDLEDDELDREQYEEHSSALIKMRNTQENIVLRERRMRKMAQELKKTNMTIDEDVEEKITLSRTTLAEALDMAYDITLKFSKFVNEEREFDITILDLRPIIGNIPYDTMIKKLNESLKHLTAGRDLMDNPEHLNEVLAESIQSPWIAYNEILKNEEVDVRDLNQQLAVTKTELLERNTTIAVNKKTIEELNVSVEVLNKRVTESGNKNDRTVELEKSLTTSSNKIESLSQNIHLLEAQLKQATKENQTNTTKAPTMISKIPVPVTASADTSILKRQVANLESTVRDIHMAKGQQQIPVQFEQLKPKKPKTKTELDGIAERASMNMKAAMDRLAMQKKENKKPNARNTKTTKNTNTTNTTTKTTSMTRRYLAAEQTLNGFRTALQQQR